MPTVAGRRGEDRTSTARGCPLASGTWMARFGKSPTGGGDVPPVPDGAGVRNLVQGGRPLADYLRVWSRTFADVLDDALGVTPGPVSYASRSATTFTQQPVNPFLFVKMPAFAGARVTYGTATWTKPAGTQAVAEAPEPAEVRRPVRTLSGVQQRALECLTALGARLIPDFTAAELRREYRQLARRVHPDRHPHASAEEHARLSREFSDATDAYRLLLGVVEPRH